MAKDQERTGIPEIVVDQQDKLAVEVNDPRIASWLGYEKPSDTRLEGFEVLDANDKVLFVALVAQGSVLSAIWVEAFIV